MNMNKKLFAGMCLSVLFGSAQALPITDTLTPDSPVTLRTDVPYGYTHSLLTHGFDTTVDTLEAATLDIDISGPGGQTLVVSFDAAQAFSGSLNAFGSGLFQVNLAYLQQDGLLEVVLLKGGGAGSTFTFTGSTLSVTGTSTPPGNGDTTETGSEGFSGPNDVIPTDVGGAARIDVARVPEPASLALVGLGLAGLGAIRRRRSA